MPGPAGQQAEQVPHVSEWFDLVHPAAREERDEDRVDVGAVVAADEEPVLAAHHLPSEVDLADIVVQRQAPVFEEAAKRLALVASVADRLRHRRFVEHARQLLLTPLKERVGDRGGPGLTDLASLPRGGADHRARAKSAPM